MTRDTCIHYHEASGLCRARSPTCASHYDDVCRAAGKLKERPPARNYGFHFNDRRHVRIQADP